MGMAKYSNPSHPDACKRQKPITPALSFKKAQGLRFSTYCSPTTAEEITRPSRHCQRVLKKISGKFPRHDLPANCSQHSVVSIRIFAQAVLLHPQTEVAFLLAGMFEDVS